MYKHIPNLITLVNLLSGTVSLYMVVLGDYKKAIIFIAVALVCDLLDGLAARLLHASSEVGKQLDSLADMISFGLLPAAMLLEVVQGMETVMEAPGFNAGILSWGVLLIPAFSAIRLARFNVSNYSTDFIGLPTPASAIFWIGFYYDFHSEGAILVKQLSPGILLATLLLMTILMIAPVKMFSLKLKNLKFRENIYVYILLIISLILFLLFGISSLSLIILTYILLSLVRIVLT